MKRTRQSAEQIILKLKTEEQLNAEGKTVPIQSGLWMALIWLRSHQPDCRRTLKTELLTMATKAQILADRWRWEYNANRPHSALQGLTPLEAVQQGASARQHPPTLIRPGPTKGVASK